MPKDTISNKSEAIKHILNDAEKYNAQGMGKKLFGIKFKSILESLPARQFTDLKKAYNAMNSTNEDEYVDESGLHFEYEEALLEVYEAAAEKYTGGKYLHPNYTRWHNLEIQ